MKLNKKQLERATVELTAALKQITKIDHLEIKIESVERKGEQRLAMTSNDLAQVQYPRMFKTLKIENFGGHWVYNETTKQDEYWMPIHYHYQHFTGGNNGSDIATVWLSPCGSIIHMKNQLEGLEKCRRCGGEVTDVNGYKGCETCGTQHE